MYMQVTDYTDIKYMNNLFLVSLNTTFPIHTAFTAVINFEDQKCTPVHSYQNAAVHMDLIRNKKNPHTPMRMLIALTVAFGCLLLLGRYGK